MPDDVESIDDLAELSPEEFVAARDALARRLKTAGDAAQAAAVKRLRRPTVAQWIGEQVRRQHPDAIHALRAASVEVVSAQEAAITGGDRDSLRSATTRRREAVRAVGRVVDDVLAANGRPAQHRDEILSTIESAAAADVAAGTFGVRDDLQAPSRPRRSKPDPVAERRAAKAAAAIEAAEARVVAARQELERAETALAVLRVDNR